VKRLLLIAAMAVAAGYVAICVLLFALQRKLVFPAPHSAGAVPCVPGTPTVVFFHGNGECASDSEWLAHSLAPRGIGFCAVEYPGYGAMPGEPSEKGIYEAAEAVLKTLPRDQIVLVGQSIGTGPAVEMAARGWGTKLVLISPFTSLGDVAQAHLPWLPAKWLVRDRFDSASKASKVAVPVLVVHGDEDEVVPYALGQKLTTMFPHAELMTVSGAHHNDLWDSPGLLDRLAAFVK
jgi:pimeloyl-ACP methyl ester carboxylesterase